MTTSIRIEITDPELTETFEIVTEKQGVLPDFWRLVLAVLGAHRVEWNSQLDSVRSAVSTFNSMLSTDETEYLLKDPSNATKLKESISELEKEE